MSDVREIDFDNPKLEQVQSLMYRFMRNVSEDEAAKVVAKVLSDFTNSISHDSRILVNESMRDHRTLLQGKMEFVFLMIAEAARAYKEKNYDGRNEYSFKLAAEIYDALVTSNDGKDGQYHKLRLGVPLI